MSGFANTASPTLPVGGTTNVAGTTGVGVIGAGGGGGGGHAATPKEGGNGTAGMIILEWED